MFPVRFALLAPCSASHSPRASFSISSDYLLSIACLSHLIWMSLKRAKRTFFSCPGPSLPREQGIEKWLPCSCTSSVNIVPLIPGCGGIRFTSLIVFPLCTVCPPARLLSEAIECEQGNMSLLSSLSFSSTVAGVFSVVCQLQTAASAFGPEECVHLSHQKDNLAGYPDNSNPVTVPPRAQKKPLHGKIGNICVSSQGGIIN